MTFVQALPSVREQWWMSTRAILPQSDWALFDSQGVVLHNDDVYVFTYNDEPADGGFGYVEHLSLYRLHEGLGFERLTPGNRIMDSMTNYDFTLSVTSGNLATDPIYWYFGDVGYVLSDGQYLYVFDAQRFIRVDPVTLDWETIAGGLATGDATDAPVGTNARVAYSNRRGQVYGGYLWFTDGNNTVDGTGLLIRRVSLTAPYPVETVFQATPLVGAEYRDTNPATGLPYLLDLDTMLHAGHTVTFDISDGVMYLINSGADYFQNVEFNATDGLRCGAIYRIPLDDFGAGELLYYALDRYLGGTEPRDMTSEFSAHAPVVQYVSGAPYDRPYEPGTGAPDLEGFEPITSSCAMVGSQLTFINAPVFTGNWNGYTIVAMDIPALEAQVAVSGPVRHNRSEPFYHTIANGTQPTEGYSNWNYNNRQRVWYHRSGGTPLFWHAALASLATNPSSERYASSLLFLSPSYSQHLAAADSPWNTDIKMGQIVCELSPVGPESSSYIDVHLKFDGTELKGFSPQYPLVRQDPPEEVVLS